MNEERAGISARWAASRYRRGYHAGVEHEDIVQAAWVGILERPNIPSGQAARYGIVDMFRQHLGRNGHRLAAVNACEIPLELIGESPVGFDEAATLARVAEMRAERLEATRERARTYYRNYQRRVRAKRRAA